MRVEGSWKFVAGFAVGGAAVALLGRARQRAMVRDKSMSLAKGAAGATRRRAKDLRQRLRGVVYQAKARLSQEGIPDDILVERVRAQLGKPVSHPRAIEVRACDGCVTLAGPILADEAEDLIRQVSRIPGVVSIDCELDLHDTAGNVPALQH